MEQINRRQYFKLLLGRVLQTAGTVVVASAVLPARAGLDKIAESGEELAKTLRVRADQLVDGQPLDPEGEAPELSAFVNGGFRNAAFRNAGGGGGGFRNAGFANGGGGGAFRNGGFANGGWRNI